MTTSSTLPKTFKAAVLTGINKPLEIKDVPMLEPGAGEILIKVHACGVCHSDHGVHSGAFGPLQIARLGHEFIGTVVSLGAGVDKWQPGDCVGGKLLKNQIPSHIHGGRCSAAREMCRHLSTAKCQDCKA